MKTVATSLDRFKRIVGFQSADRPPRWETFGFWDETVAKWTNESNFSPDADPKRYYDMEERPSLPGNLGHEHIPFTPLFEEKLIEDEGETRVCQNAYGVTLRYMEGTTSMPQWLGFPVETRQDWENVKRRIDPEMHDYGDFEQVKLKFVDNQEPNGLSMCGVYGFYRNLFGEENLAYAFYDCPEILHDMGKRWLEFYSTVGGRVISECRCDYVMFFEDMAFKTGPLVGPSIFREFMTPYYRALIGHFRRLGVEYFCVDSDGSVDVLIPLFLDVGVNIMLPFEVAAGNDVLDIRERYPNLVIWGGLDKRVLNRGKEEIKREVMEKVPVMWEKGGYIPSIDHSTQPCPLENWEYCLELLRRLFN